MHEPEKLDDLVTPCFVVDKGRVEQNCRAMRGRCEHMGVSLRPMMKTHKCLEAGIIATGGSKRCLSTSTVAEAEFYADAGFDDLLITLIFTEDKIHREKLELIVGGAAIVGRDVLPWQSTLYDVLMKALHLKLEKLHVMVDSDYGVNVLEKHSVAEKKWSAFLMIDAGDKRSGQLCDSPDAVNLAKRIDNSSSVDLAGLYVHDGGSYCHTAKEVTAAGEKSTNKLLVLSKRLKEAGIDLKTVGIGSTPTSSQPSQNMARLTELHPGNYIFYDVQQVLLGSCKLSDIAGRVATRVTGHYPHRNQILVDAGFLATSQDGPKKIPHGGSYCMVENEPNLILVDAHQEVGFISAVEGDLNFSKYPIGSLLYLLPWHACAVAQMHGWYHVHDGDKIIGTWKNAHYW